MRRQKCAPEAILDTVVKGIQARALEIRIDSIKSTSQAKSGHPTSCLSAADIASVLFFSEFVGDFSTPEELNCDRFVLSKGHAAPLLHSVLRQFGIISEEELLTLRLFSSKLEGHPTPRLAPGIVSTGSLGQGLSIGVGMALGLHRAKVCL